MKKSSLVIGILVLIVLASLLYAVSNKKSKYEINQEGFDKLCQSRGDYTSASSWECDRNDKNCKVHCVKEVEVEVGAPVF